MKISKLIIIRKLLYFEPDVSGSSAPRLASRCSLRPLFRQLPFNNFVGPTPTIRRPAVRELLSDHYDGVFSQFYNTNIY